MSVAWVGAGISAVSAIDGMGAAGDAADAQAQGANKASGISKEAQAWNSKNLQSWVNTGTNANNALATRLGIAQNPWDVAVQELTRQAKSVNPELSSNWVPDASNVEKYMAQNPMAGTSDPQYGSLTKQFDAADLAKDLPYQSGLQFGLDTGTNQLNQRAAASGGYGSGAALKALTRFGNDYASTKVGEAYGRNMGEKNQIYGMLSGQSQQGQNAAAGVGAAGNSAANMQGQYATGAGNAQSAGIIGGSNALWGGIGDATNAVQWNQLLNKGSGSSYYRPPVVDGGYSVGQGSAYGGSRAGL